jgi:hypothetical protein
MERYKYVAQGGEGCVFNDLTTNKIIKVFHDKEKFEDAIRGIEFFNRIDNANRYTIPGTEVKVDDDMRRVFLTKCDVNKSYYTDKAIYAIEFEDGGKTLREIAGIITKDTADVFLKGLIELFRWICEINIRKIGSIPDLHSNNIVSKNINGPFKLIDLSIFEDKSPYNDMDAKFNMDNIKQSLNAHLNKTEYKIDVPEREKDADAYITKTIAFLEKLNALIEINQRSKAGGKRKLKRTRRNPTKNRKSRRKRAPRNH